MGCSRQAPNSVTTSLTEPESLLALTAIPQPTIASAPAPPRFCGGGESKSQESTNLIARIGFCLAGLWPARKTTSLPNRRAQ